MKVILNQTVPKVGKEGQVVTVANGFARNYLFPRGLAIVAEKNQIAALERRNERMAAKLAEGKATAEATKDQIDGKVIRLEGNVGQGTKLFGAITAQDVADAVRSQLGVVVDKKNVALIEPIKRLGAHKVEIDLHREVDAIITVDVFDPNAPVEAPAAPAPEAEEA
ncbi:MAG TPA: 50S ribosomal protein L9 [Fimbriimonadaceae bacterium]|nr:50S ribosomal protein L9 [Fimbriimonadaceae bacterium]